MMNYKSKLNYYKLQGKLIEIVVNNIKFNIKILKCDYIHLSRSLLIREFIMMPFKI